MSGIRMLSTSSGLKSASSQIINQSGYLMGIDVVTPTTGTTLLTFYDSENSTTTDKLIIAEVEVDAGFSTLNHEFYAPVIANRGIYVTLTGQTVNYIIRYSL